MARRAHPYDDIAELVSSAADSDYWAENRIVTVASIRRMADVEFVAELLIGVMHGPQGGGAASIDQYYEQYEDYEDSFPGQRPAKRLFEETLGLVRAALPDIRDSRWSNKSDFYSLFVALAQLRKHHPDVLLAQTPFAMALSPLQMRLRSERRTRLQRYPLRQSLTYELYSVEPTTRQGARNVMPA